MLHVLHILSINFWPTRIYFLALVYGLGHGRQPSSLALGLDRIGFGTWNLWSRLWMCRSTPRGLGGHSHIGWLFRWILHHNVVFST